MTLPLLMFKTAKRFIVVTKEKKSGVILKEFGCFIKCANFKQA